MSDNKCNSDFFYKLSEKVTDGTLDKSLKDVKLNSNTVSPTLSLVSSIDTNNDSEE